MMDENYSWLPKVAENYSVEIQGQPILLNEREQQRVFRVDTADGKALTVRLCTPGQEYERVQVDTATLLYLDRAGFPAPVLRLTKDGKQVFEWQPGSFGYAHDFIDGEHPEMDLPTLQELATLLGRLHVLTNEFEAFPAQVDWLDELETAIERAESCATDPQWGTQAREVAATLRSLPDFGDLPTGLIHTDVHEGNLLRTPEGKLYMLDWEDAGLGEMIFDLALVLGWNCVWPISKNLSGQVTRYDFDEDWSKAFLSAYQQLRPITDHEAQHLGAAIRFVMGWFAARDIAREVVESGISDELAFTNWAIMRSVTPRWDTTLAQWVKETRPVTPNLPE